MLTFKIFVQDKKKNWLCPKCSNCSYCNLKFKPVSNSINCDSCDGWVHLKCSGLTKEKFHALSVSQDPWYCRPCLNKIFPFNSIDNNKLLSTMQTKVKIPTLSHNIIQKANPYCTKCLKQVLQPHKGIYCTSCNHIIHKKCSPFNKNDTCPMRECLSCICEKFPFGNMSNDELVTTSYNSNDNCLCGTKSPKININNILGKYKVSINPTHLDKGTPIANSIVENTTDQFIDLKPNFNYYDIHEFHKLKQNKIPKSTIS